jgi:hypothetical protein
MPKHRKAHQTSAVLDDQTMTHDLQHERDQPDDTEGDVQAVSAYKREKRG